jgi:hypothetical protein
MIPKISVDSKIREKKPVLFSSKMVANRDGKIHNFLCALRYFRKKGTHYIYINYSSGMKSNLENGKFLSLI